MNFVEKISILKKIIIGIQFLFVAFGATVLVPLLVGIDPSLALFSAGVGTLLFHFITRGKVPVFLGSSFAFIAPIIEATRLFGYRGMLSGIVAIGVVYTVASFLVRWKGKIIIEKLFPKVVIGPVIIIIGLSLAPTAVDMAKSNWLLAIISLLTSIFIVVYTKGLIKLIPIFIGIVVGYLVAVIIGKVDFTPVAEARWFLIPEFALPVWSWKAVLFMIPVAIAPIIEHVGDIYAIGEVTGKDYVKDPGLHRTLLGDGLATSLAGFFGSVPNTTYSEVTGAISLTKMGKPVILRISAITAILFSLTGKIGGVLKSIPSAVLGGIMLLLFGMIASVGIKTLVESKTDLNSTRNMVIISVILTVGIGGAAFNLDSFSLSGIGLASVVGVILNLILPKQKAGTQSETIERH